MWTKFNVFSIQAGGNSRLIYTKSPNIGAGDVSEPRQLSQVVSARNRMRIEQCVPAVRAAEVTCILLIALQSQGFWRAVSFVRLAPERLYCKMTGILWM